MITFLTLFIALALTFYVLFAGADFGAGILELFKNRYSNEQQKLVTKAMGPVWEANHVWLILILVIFFMGFPELFVIGSIYLHIPAVAVLIGIVLRGCAFTYRHYDPDASDHQKVYTLTFSWSSLWTSLWLGILAGSFQRGQIPSAPTNFWDAYVHPWLGVFPFSVGVFTASIFAFLAAVYLLGETSNRELKKHLRYQALVANLSMLIAGGGVFVAARIEGLTLFRAFLDPFGLVPVLLSALAFFPLWRGILTEREKYSRLIAGFQVLMVLVGWYRLNAESVVLLKNGTEISFYSSAAPEIVQRRLLEALIVGAFLTLPSLYYLMRVFKGNRFWLSNK